MKVRVKDEGEGVGVAHSIACVCANRFTLRSRMHSQAARFVPTCTRLPHTAQAHGTLGAPLRPCAIPCPPHVFNDVKPVVCTTLLILLWLAACTLLRRLGRPRPFHPAQVPHSQNDTCFSWNGPSSAPLCVAVIASNATAQGCRGATRVQ